MLALLEICLLAAPPVGVYLGEFDDAPPSARIAAVAGEAELLVYVCSEDDDFNDAYGRWFRGPLRPNGGFEIVVDGLTLGGALAHTGGAGKIESAFLSARTFRLKPIDPDGGAGLFRLQEIEGAVKCTTGWIVDADGRTVGSAVRQREAEASSGGVARVAAQRTPARGERILPDGLEAAHSRSKPTLQPLPGDRLRVRLTGMNAEARTLLVTMRGVAHELPLRSKQLVLIEDDGARLEEVATVARTRQSLARLPTPFADRVQALFDEQTPVTLKIGAGRVEIRRVRLPASRTADGDEPR